MSAPHRLLNPVVHDELTIKVIGLGGVGGIAARYLTPFLAKYDSRMVLIDGDNFEPANASRMLFSECGNKAVVLRNELLPHIQNTKLSIVAVDCYVREDNVHHLIREKDIVILAVDNHNTRKLVNDHCAKLQDVCLISGGNDGMDDKDGKLHRGTYGNVQVFIRHGGQDASPSLTRYHPEIANPEDKHPSDKSCTELVVSVPQVLFTNMIVATSILGTLLLYLSQALHYSEVAFDLADGVMNPIPIPSPNPNLWTTTKSS